MPAAPREPRVAESSTRRTSGACRRSTSTWRTAPTSWRCGSDMEAVCASRCCRRRGSRSVSGFDNRPHPGEVIHEMGTARMGRDPKTSVLNAFNQCHDARERVRHRRRLHGVDGVPEPVADLHGADGARVRVRRRAVEARRASDMMSHARRPKLQLSKLRRSRRHEDDAVVSRRARP